MLGAKRNKTEIKNISRERSSFKLSNTFKKVGEMGDSKIYYSLYLSFIKTLTMCKYNHIFMLVLVMPVLRTWL